MYNVLFVCTGNICRSPTAEVLLRHKVKQQGLEREFHIDSVGLYAYHEGESPDSRSIATAKARGVNMSGQVARKMTADDFEKFDLILAMDKGHYEQLAMRGPHVRDKIKMFLDFYGGARGQGVPDPYYDGQHVFEHVYELIEQGTEALFQHLLTMKER